MNSQLASGVQPIALNVAPGPGDPDLVSVVIPTFNRGYCLAETIESVLAQTYTPLEVIVVDDGSSDDTRQVVERFGDRVRYIYQANGGVSSARNAGFRQSRGEFIALLDSDDIWFPWKLAAQIALLKAYPAVGLTWSDFTVVDEAGKETSPRGLRQIYTVYDRCDPETAFAKKGRLGDHFSTNDPAIAEGVYYTGDIFGAMMLGSLVHTSTAVMRRWVVDQIGGFDQSRPTPGEDYEFHMHGTYLAPAMLLDLSTILYRYGAPDQLTAMKHEVTFASENLVSLNKWIVQGGDRHGLTKAQENKLLVEAHAWIGRAELRAGRMRRARRGFGSSLRLKWIQPRVWLLWLISALPSWVYRGIQTMRGKKYLRMDDPPITPPQPA